jgi:hypothetical protein
VPCLNKTPCLNGAKPCGAGSPGLFLPNFAIKGEYRKIDRRVMTFPPSIGGYCRALISIAHNPCKEGTAEYHGIFPQCKQQAIARHYYVFHNIAR